MEILQIPGAEHRALLARLSADSSRPAKLGTLGPEGTSSEYIAEQLSRCFDGNARSFHIVLEETYEECLDGLAAGRLDLVLVAHAYANINAFYMNPRLEPAAVLRGSTPEYGLATRHDFDYDEEMLFTDTVVTHPAPVPLLGYHFDRPVKHETVTSTSKAAGHVAEGSYNIAITNEQAAQQHNLKFVYRFERIPMTWTVFSKRKDLNELASA
ncbi:hypothetical protein AB0O91_07170 [Kitasatospora sp. NPDC089797]|uniref:hypothetical protein n=1 Tax=Kitasatospora sp. NPDC089797 TaxID=3155298 RepID=UPI003436AF47